MNGTYLLLISTFRVEKEQNHKQKSEGESAIINAVSRPTNQHHPPIYLVVVGRLLRILRLLMKLLRWRLRILRLRVRLLLLRLLRGRRMATGVAVLLRRRTRITTVSVGPRTSTTAITLLRQQDSTNTFVNRLEGRQVGR